MKVATGKVVGGKVVLEGVSLEEGTSVTVLAKDDEVGLRSRLSKSRICSFRLPKPTAGKPFLLRKCSRDLHAVTLNSRERPRHEARTSPDRSGSAVVG